jgi:hypothetical protein
MRKFCLLAFAAMILISNANAQGVREQMPTPFEKNGTNVSTTYAEMIAFYKGLAATSPMVKIVDVENGTDVGRPLQMVVISASKIFNPIPLRQADTRIVMVMNGIHPGEPDGIDASMILARDLGFGQNLCATAGAHSRLHHSRLQYRWHDGAQQCQPRQSKRSGGLWLSGQRPKP